MKKLKDLLSQENFRKKSGRIEEKHLEKVFFDVFKKDLPSLNRSDIKHLKVKDNVIILKASHPAVSSEVWRKKEKLKENINKFLENPFIEEIKVK